MFLNLLNSTNNTFKKSTSRLNAFVAAVCIAVFGSVTLLSAEEVRSVESAPITAAVAGAGTFELDGFDPATGGPADHRTPAKPTLPLDHRLNDSGRSPPVSVPKKEEELSTSEKIRLRLTVRYGNPVVERLVWNTSADRTLSLYREVSSLIDNRHIEPASYSARTAAALNNLWFAVENSEFLRVNRSSFTSDKVAAYRNALKSTAAKYPVRSGSDAMNLMSAVMQMSERQFGLHASTVGMEFVFGATESLDKYSAFTPEEPSRKPSAASNPVEDQVVGIGVEIKSHDDGLLVVRPLKGGPAAEAGLKGGDIIVAVNGKPLAGKTLDYGADLIAGPEGSRITLNLVREGKALAPITVVRRRVQIMSVSEVAMIDEVNHVGYIKLDKFAAKSSEEMDQALWQLYRAGMKSLVIDLRGNPGGLLTTAIEISDKFLPGGTIVSTKGRNPQQDNSQEYASYDRTWKVPLAVIIDGNSASASEIFAAAIQENGRGVIVGRKSYGKGTVQTQFPVSSVSGSLRLTTARFYSPSGNAMAGVGVTPDITVANETADGSFSTNDADIRAAAEAARSDRAQQMSASKSRSSSPAL